MRGFGLPSPGHVENFVEYIFFVFANLIKINYNISITVSLWYPKLDNHLTLINKSKKIFISMSIPHTYYHFLLETAGCCWQGANGSRYVQYSSASGGRLLW